MQKKWYSVIISMALFLLVTYPHNVLAQGTESPFDFTAITADRSGEGWVWDADAKTLSLDGFSYQSDQEYERFMILPAGSRIILANGSINEIDLLAHYTIYGEGELTIAGDGILKIQNRAVDLREADAAIMAEGKVAVEDVQLYITGGNGGIIADQAEAGGIRLYNSDLRFHNVSMALAANADIGLLAMGGLQMLDSQIDIEANVNGIFANGISAKRTTIDIIINTDMGGTALESIGSYAANELQAPILIEDGKLSIESMGNGIISQFGSLLQVKNSEVDVRANDVAIKIWSKGQGDDSEIELIGSRIIAEGKMGVLIFRPQDQDNDRPVVTDDAIITGKTDLKLQKILCQSGGAPLGSPRLYEAAELYCWLPDTVEIEGADDWKDSTEYRLMDKLPEAAANGGRQRLEICSAGYQRQDNSGKLYYYGAYEGEAEEQQMILPWLNNDKGYIDANGRLVVPLRAFTEKMGYDVQWDAAQQTITITEQPQSFYAAGPLIFTVGSQNYRDGSIVKTMDTAAVLTEEGRVYVPLRYVLENMGMTIDTAVEDDGSRRILLLM